MARIKENGAGTFRKIGDKWNYQFSYIDNTVRKLKNFTAETKEECLIKAEEFLLEHSNGIDNEKNFTTITDLVLKNTRMITLKIIHQSRVMRETSISLNSLNNTQSHVFL